MHWNAFFYMLFEFGWKLWWQFCFAFCVYVCLIGKYWRERQTVLYNYYHYGQSMYCMRYYEWSDWARVNASSFHVCWNDIKQLVPSIHHFCSLRVCVCLCVACVYVCAYMCVWEWEKENMCMHVCMWVRECVRMFACVCCVYACVCVHACVSVCVWKCTMCGHSHTILKLGLCTSLLTVTNIVLVCWCTQTLIWQIIQKCDKKILSFTLVTVQLDGFSAYSLLPWYD